MLDLIHDVGIQHNWLAHNVIQLIEDVQKLSSTIKAA